MRRRDRRQTRELDGSSDVVGGCTRRVLGRQPTACLVCQRSVKKRSSPLSPPSQDKTSWARKLTNETSVLPCALDSNGEPHVLSFSASVSPQRSDIVVTPSRWGRRQVRGTVNNVVGPDRGWTLPCLDSKPEVLTLSSLSISKLTSSITRLNKATPSAQATWDAKLGHSFKWAKIWAPEK